MTHEHRHGRRRARRARQYAPSRRFRGEWDRGDRIDVLEEHRRDVEEYLADLSEEIKRLRDKEGVNAPTSAQPEASPEPS
jgi:hypothetical protein